MTAREEVTRLLATMTQRMKDAEGRVFGSEDALWFGTKLHELTYHVTRAYGDQ